MNIKLDPITPGEILKEEFMEPLHLSANKLARDIDVPVNRISDILRGRRSITADTAIRLEYYFGIEAQFWLNLQANFDLKCAKILFPPEVKTNIKRHSQQLKRAA